VSHTRLALGDDYDLFRQQVRRFIHGEILPHYEPWERAGVTPQALWRLAGERGLLNCALPTPFGAGGDFGHAAVVIEELAHANVMGVGFSVHSDMVAPYLLAHGDDSQRLAWLPGMARGDIIGAIAMTEPDAGSDLKQIRTRAQKVDGGYVINGRKTFITNGVNAHMLIVAASTRPELGARGITLFCVNTAIQGVTRSSPLRKIGLHAQDVCEIFLDDVHVSDGCRLGQENFGFDYLMTGLTQERLAIAVSACASLHARLADAIEYSRQRKVFGKRIIDHQNTRFKLADARAQATMLRVFLDDCLLRHLRGELSDEHAAMAKLRATELHCTVLDDLLQLYGGYGYMAEFDIGRAWCDARAMRLYGGTSEILREIIGRMD